MYRETFGAKKLSLTEPLVGRAVKTFADCIIGTGDVHGNSERDNAMTLNLKIHPIDTGVYFQQKR